jgi:hypothetical protein
MDFRYQRMQMINKPSKIEDEGHRANTNQANSIPRVPNNSQWYWFQKKHPLIII